MAEDPPPKKTLNEMLAAVALPPESTAPQDDNEQAVRLRAEVYNSFRMHVCAGFMLIYRHFAELNKVPFDWLQVQVHDDGTAIRLHLDARVSTVEGHKIPHHIYTPANLIANEIVTALKELDLDGLSFFGSLRRGHYTVKIESPEQLLILLRTALDTAGASPLRCLDDLEGSEVIMDAASARKVIGQTDHMSLWYLPGGLQKSAKAAFLLQNEARQRGVLPFSMKEIESLLFQANVPENATVVFPAELQAFRRH